MRNVYKLDQSAGSYCALKTPTLWDVDGQRSIHSLSIVSTAVIKRLPGKNHGFMLRVCTKVVLHVCLHVFYLSGSAPILHDQLACVPRF